MSWLPKRFEFLSGLPEPARRRRYLMAVQAFVDESGGLNQGRYFVSVGLVAHSERWAVFSDEWKACLDESPRIAYFKMREAAGFTGQFYRFSERDRNNKLLSLATIIDRNVSFVVFSSIDLEAHGRTWALWDKPQNEPYFWTFHNTINAVCFELWDLGWREKFEILFDDQVIFGPRARLWYPVVRDVTSLLEPAASALLPVDPMFKSDLEFLPIQACDLIAWCGRNDGENPTNRPFEWLVPAITKPYVTKHSQFYDEERLRSVMAESRHQFLRLKAGLNPGAAELSRRYKAMWKNA